MGVNIAFDADGVLFDTESFQLSREAALYMKKKFNKTIADENGYGIKDVFDCSEQEEMKFWTHFAVKYSLFYKARLNAREVISKLRSQGNNVYIITSKACAQERNYKGLIVKLLFELGLRLNGIIVDRIEYCSLANSAEAKANVCESKGIRIMVEDKKENVERISQQIKVLCFNSRNNQGEYNENVLRVYEFNEVYANIQRLIGTSSGRPNIFTEGTLKSKSEKLLLEDVQLKRYFQWLKGYYSALPFDHKRVTASEERMNILNRFFSPVFERRYHPYVIGKENITQKRGIIVVCNHLCDKDMLLLLYGLYGENVPWHPLVKKEVLDEKVGIIFSSAYSVFVDRKDLNSRHLATQELAKLLVYGYNVVIFPEGTYNKTGNPLKDFSGVSHVYLSQALQCPIMNCALTKDYSTNPVLMIDKQYTVSPDISIDEAASDSFQRLNELVNKVNAYSRKRTGYKC